MSPFITGAIFGLVGGIAGTAYAVYPPFREKVNGLISGVFSGKKGRKSKKSESPAPKRRVEKTEECAACHKVCPRSELREATVNGTKATVWIHEECPED
jgi:NAD-dependent dihydropyrimidine dehydrogenase PreA subunit